MLHVLLAAVVIVSCVYISGQDNPDFCIGESCPDDDSLSESNLLRRKSLLNSEDDPINEVGLLQKHLKHPSLQDGYLDAQHTRDVSGFNVSSITQLEVSKLTSNGTKWCKDCVAKPDTVQELIETNTSEEVALTEDEEEEEAEQADRCDGWCGGNPNSWDTKCNWAACKGCSDCAAPPAGGRCDGWCAGNPNSWTTKCPWAACKGCSDCAAPPPAPPPPPAGGRCDSWCAGNPKSWTEKCPWAACKGCSDCTAPAPAPAGRCDSWCAGNPKSWTEKCPWAACKGCSDCTASSPPAPPPGRCDSWCAGNPKSWTEKCPWAACKGCSDCGASPAPPPGRCDSWCAGNPKSWTEKCPWAACAGCGDCAASSAPPAPPAPLTPEQMMAGECADWCADNPSSWDTKCGNAACRQCGDCKEDCVEEDDCPVCYSCRNSKCEAAPFVLEGTGQPGPWVKWDVGGETARGQSDIVCMKAMYEDSDCKKDYFAYAARAAEGRQMCLCKRGNAPMVVKDADYIDYYKPSTCEKFDCTTGSDEDCATCKPEKLRQWANDCATCNDGYYYDDKVCKPQGTCGTDIIQCPESMLPKDADTYCTQDPSSCDIVACCEEKALCSTATDVITCPDGERLKSSNTSHCAGVTCIDTDEEACCEEITCTVPLIAEGVRHFQGEHCEAGRTVAVGSTCTIVESLGWTCTDPGECGMSGEFANAAACTGHQLCSDAADVITCLAGTRLADTDQYRCTAADCAETDRNICCLAITCTVPQIVHGPRQWDGFNCNSGSPSVHAGDVCSIVSYPEYTCVSPGLCNNDGTFANEAKCELNQVCKESNVTMTCREGERINPSPEARCANLNCIADDAEVCCQENKYHNMGAGFCRTWGEEWPTEKARHLSVQTLHDCEVLCENAFGCAAIGYGGEMCILYSEMAFTGGNGYSASPATCWERIAAYQAAYSPVVDGRACVGGTILQGKKDPEPGACAMEISHHTECSQVFFNHATDGDGSCACITDLETDCANFSNQETSSTMRIYRIEAINNATCNSINCPGLPNETVNKAESTFCPGDITTCEMEFCCEAITTTTTTVFVVPEPAPPPAPPAVPTPPPVVRECAGWCANNPNPLETKCTYRACNGCAGCPGVPSPSPSDSPTPASESPTPAAPPTPPAGECAGWCAGNPKSWAEKCPWRACRGCTECPAALMQISNMKAKRDIEECAGWCSGNPNSWTTKCPWRACKGCNDCSAGSPTPAADSPTPAADSPTPAADAPTPAVTPVGSCASWCAGNVNSWDKKCKWGSCKCGECEGRCDSWCEGNVAEWSDKCKWAACKTCGMCSVKPSIPPQERANPCYSGYKFDHIGWWGGGWWVGEIQNIETCRNRCNTASTLTQKLCGGYSVYHQGGKIYCTLYMSVYNAITSTDPRNLACVKGPCPLGYNLDHYGDWSQPVGAHLGHRSEQACGEQCDLDWECAGISYDSDRRWCGKHIVLKGGTTASKGPRFACSKECHSRVYCPVLQQCVKMKCEEVPQVMTKRKDKMYCEGQPGGMNNNKYRSEEACEEACRKNWKCVAYDWYVRSVSHWCVQAYHCVPKDGLMFSHAQKDIDSLCPGSPGHFKFRFHGMWSGEQQTSMQPDRFVCARNCRIDPYCMGYVWQRYAREEKWDNGNCRLYIHSYGVVPIEERQQWKTNDIDSVACQRVCASSEFCDRTQSCDTEHTHQCKDQCPIGYTSSHIGYWYESTTQRANLHHVTIEDAYPLQTVRDCAAECSNNATCASFHFEDSAQPPYQCHIYVNPALGPYWQVREVTNFGTVACTKDGHPPAPDWPCVTGYAPEACNICDAPPDRVQINSCKHCNTIAYKLARDCYERSHCDIFRCFQPKPANLGYSVQCYTNDESCDLDTCCGTWQCETTVNGTGCESCVPEGIHRTCHNHCATCHPGYELYGLPGFEGLTCHRCRAWECEVEVRPAISACATCRPQVERRVPNHCATCNDGFHLVGGYYCEAIPCNICSWGKCCKTCKFQADRTTVNDCRTCHGLWWLNRTYCEDRENCSKYFTPEGHCTMPTPVNKGVYNIDNKGIWQDNLVRCDTNLSSCTQDRCCEPWWCNRGDNTTWCASCKPIPQRTQHNDCLTCNSGYRNCAPWPDPGGPWDYGDYPPTKEACDSHVAAVIATACVPIPCNTTPAGPGCATCKIQIRRTVDNDCASCNPGWWLDSSVCVAWTCVTNTSGPQCRTCRAQSNRTAANQCTDCNHGYHLSTNFPNGASCAASAQCNAFNCGPNTGPTPVNKWFKDQYCLGLADTCDAETCCEARAVCGRDYMPGVQLCYRDTSSYDKDVRANKLDYGYHNEKDCDMDAVHPGCVDPTRVNKGYLGTLCNAQISSCNAATCCEIPAKCDTYQDCVLPTPVNKGPTVDCYFEESTCDSATCCAEILCILVPTGEGCATCKDPMDRTKINDCATCHDGFHHVLRTSCAIYACVTGPDDGCETCEPEEDRYAENDCETCNPGYHLNTWETSCLAWLCETGPGIGCATCKVQADRIRTDDCASCNGDTYFLRAGRCAHRATCDSFHCTGDTPINKGSGVMCTSDADSCNSFSCCYFYLCSTGPEDGCNTCKPKSQRFKVDDCATCNPGYYLNGVCIAYTCVTGTGVGCATCITQTSRTARNHCATCNPGYYINGTICRAYVCVTGPGQICASCTPQVDRTVDQHCATCNWEYYLTGTFCTAKARCNAFEDCVAPAPVNKGASVLCDTNLASCTNARCCEPRATCDQFLNCTDPEPVNRGVDVMCPAQLSTCTNAICCGPKALCSAFEGCVGTETPVNLGENVTCSGFLPTCTISGCCKEWRCDTGSSGATCKTCKQRIDRTGLDHCLTCHHGYYLQEDFDQGLGCALAAKCDGYDGCNSLMPVNKGADQLCLGDAESCEIIRCCEARARCNDFNGCPANLPLNKGPGFECESDINSCAVATCCEAPETTIPVTPLPAGAPAPTTEEVDYWIKIARESFGVDDPVFPESAKENFQWNVDEPQAATYLAVGTIDPSEFRIRIKHADEVMRGYMFKMVLFDATATKVADMEWAQASWIQQGSIAGFVGMYGAMNPPRGCPTFHGLCASVSPNFVFDDGPLTETCYGVGVVGNNVLGMEGGQSLYIISEATVPIGHCQRCINQIILTDVLSQAEECAKYNLDNLPSPDCDNCNKVVDDHCKNI